MKKSYLLLLAILLVAAFPFALTSCGGDDDDDAKPDQYEPTEVISEKDPDDTVVLNLPLGSRDNWYTISGSMDNLEIHVDEAGNLACYSSADQLASVGLVSGITKITSVPSTGWAQKTAVVPGNGYVLRNKDNWYDRGYEYFRIYVVSFNGSIATIKYAKLNAPDTPIND